MASVKKNIEKLEQKLKQFVNDGVFNVYMAPIEVQGNFIECSAEEVAKLVGEKLEKIQETFGNKFNQFQDQILNLIARKVISALLDMKGEITDSIENIGDAISKKIADNFTVLRDQGENYFIAIFEELKKHSAQSEQLQKYIESQNRELSTQIAQSIIQINSIEEYIKEINEKQQKTIDLAVNTNQKTDDIYKVSIESWDKLCNLALVMRSTHESVEENKSKLQQVLQSTKESQEVQTKALGILDALLNKMDTLMSYLSNMDPEVANYLTRKTISVQKDKIADTIKNSPEDQKTSKLEKLQTNILLNLDSSIIRLANEIEIFKSENEDYHTINEEHHALVKRLEKIFLQGLLIRDGEDCDICGSHKSRRLRCVVCGNENEAPPAQLTTFESTGGFPFTKKALQKSESSDPQPIPQNDDETIQILTSNYKDDAKRPYVLSLQEFYKKHIEECTSIRVILICNDVKKIILGREKSPSIMEMFPNLKIISLQKPVDGEQKYILGCKLLQGCFDENGNGVECYGMKYVCEIGEECFGKVAKGKESDFMLKKGFTISYDSIYF